LTSSGATATLKRVALDLEREAEPVKARWARLGSGWRVALILVLVAAFAARVVAYVVDPKPNYMNNLTAYQEEMARNILDHGKWFVISQKALDFVQAQQNARGFIDPESTDFSSVDKNATYKPEILEAPGLAVPLAGLWWITGQHYVYVRWVQIVLDTLMVLVVYWIALRLTASRRLSLAAAFMYALWPGALILAKTPLLDTWAGFFVILALATFLWAQTGPRRLLKLALFGLVVGLGAYFRPFILAFPLAFAIAEITRVSRRHTLESFLVPSLVAALVVAPWTVRNLQDFHRLIPMRIGVGQALWEGLGETPNSFGAVNDDGAAIRFVQARRPDLEYPSPEFDDYLLRKSLHAIVDHPVHYGELILRRAVYLLPCLLALLWRRRVPMQRGLLVAVAVAVILPYVFLRMEPRFWLPAAFAYIILLAAAVEAALPALARGALPEPSGSKLD